MQEKKKLLVDFDDTICESVTLLKVNKFLGTNYKIEDFDDYFIDNVIPKEKLDEYFETYFDEDPYENLALIEGAKEALEKLKEKYDIYICSSCILYKRPQSSAKLFASKFNYLIKNLPFLDPTKFIFTSSKDVCCGDILIDDFFHNFKSNITTKLLFESYHNKNITDDMLKERNVIRVKDWNHICKLLLNEDL